MIVYHASPVVMEKPDILHLRRNVDFGPGFYLTTLPEQARSWCKRLMIRNGSACVNTFDLIQTRASCFITAGSSKRKALAYDAI